MTRACYCAASLRISTHWRIKLALIKSRLWLPMATLTVSFGRCEGMFNCAVLCCASSQAKPRWLAEYILADATHSSCTLHVFHMPSPVHSDKVLTADGAAFRASNARFCCLRLLQQFAVDLFCNVDLQLPSRECAINSEVVRTFQRQCSATKHIKLCMHADIVRAICVSCMQVLTACDVRKSTAWSM